jgi:hypothetical protein
MHQRTTEISPGRRPNPGDWPCTRGTPVLDQRGERYRFLGHVYFDLAVGINEHGMPEGGGGGSFSSQGSPGILAWSTQEGCQAHPYVRWAIVYGLLRRRQDTAFAPTTGHAYPLRRVRIPVSLHATGPLAYAVLPQAPNDLMVQTPSGGTVLDEKLGLPAPRGCQPGESAGIGTVGG